MTKTLKFIAKWFGFIWNVVSYTTENEDLNNIPLNNTQIWIKYAESILYRASLSQPVNSGCMNAPICSPNDST